MDGYLKYHDADEQLQLVDDAVHDSRPSLPTGFLSIDVLLRRGGILPGNLVLLGGRTGTRKSTLMHNIAVNMARVDIPVGLVGLDENRWMNVAKMVSAYSGRSLAWLDERWDEDEGLALRAEWKDFARNRVAYFGGIRPDTVHLDAAMEAAAHGAGQAPAILFVDYLGLLTRDRRFGPGDSTRIPRLVEELQVWSGESGVALVLLHQLSRNDEFGDTNNRNAGHLPVTLAQLRMGGEEQADIVLGTYRKALDPVGNMDFETAKSVLGEKFDQDQYWEAQRRVKKHWHDMTVQLLKNRPGTMVERRGVTLLSPDDSMRLIEQEGHSGDKEGGPAPAEGASHRPRPAGRDVRNP